MATFNIVQSAIQGYQHLWRKRRVFLHLALLPVAIKTAGFVAIMSLGFQTNYLRQGLVLLPAYFLEGWIVAIAIRMVMLEEGKSRADYFPEGRATVACMALYVLIKLATTVISNFALLMDKEAGVFSQVAQDNPLLLFVAVVGFLFFIWAFRFFWLYVPAAMDYGLREFLAKTKGFNFSLYLMGFWFLCFVPFAACLMIVSQGLAAVFPAAVPGGMSYVAMVALAAAQAFFELCIILVSALGLAHGLQSLMRPDIRGFYR